MWWQAREAFAATPPAGQSLLHRDFHPGNVLVGRDGAVTVLDWTDASWGCGFADVGHFRANIVALHSLSLADEFLVMYMNRIGAVGAYPRIWDIYAVVGMPRELDRLCPSRVDDMRTLLRAAVRDMR